MKYKYTTISQVYTTRGKFTKRPIIELEVLGQRRSIQTFGLIDSGADTTMMNSQYAAYLGININTKHTKSFIGIGGKADECPIVSVQFKVKGFNTIFETMVAFTNSESVDILLGQEDFFELFKVKFEKDHDIFELVEVKK